MPDAFPTHAERAAAGAAFLDAEWPKVTICETVPPDTRPWYDLVDVKDLRMLSQYRCVLALLGRHVPLERQSEDRIAYGDAIDALGLRNDPERRVLLGFSVHIEHDDEDLLTRAFRDQIIQRREARFTTPA